jgi:hypothetical protein
MQIPNSDRAVIDAEKLRGYLLSKSHLVGRFKAAFFQALGYTDDQWHQLQTDLRTQHLLQNAPRGEDGVYGRKYVIRATLVGPSGTQAMVASIWVVRAGEEFPRFVTAYPEVRA